MRRTHCREKSNGYPRAEPREAEAYLKQYVEAARGEPARLVANKRGQSCRSGVSAVAVEALMNNVGKVKCLLEEAQNV